MVRLQLKLPLIKYKYWVKIMDGDPAGRNLYKRHYSARRYRDGRITKKFVGPGQYLALITPDCLALFVWRKFIPMDRQKGINCAIFRNEGNTLSSALILEAERFVLDEWGPERVYTYINPGKIKSPNPGYCFKVAGWRSCDRTKGGLVILEKTLEENPYKVKKCTQKPE